MGWGPFAFLLEWKDGGGRERGGFRQNKPAFKVLNPRHPLLGVCHHLPEQVGETGAAEFRSPAAVQVAVVDRFAVRGGAETVADAGGAALRRSL